MNRPPRVLQSFARRRPMSGAVVGALIWGVVVAPLAHSVGHRLDHTHGASARRQVHRRAHTDQHQHSGHGDHAHGQDHAHGREHAHEHVNAGRWEPDSDRSVDEHSPHARRKPQGEQREADGREPREQPRHKPHGHGSLEHFGVALTTAPTFLPPKSYRADSPIPAIEYEAPSLSRRPLDSMRVRGPPEARAKSQS